MSDKIKATLLPRLSVSRPVTVLMVLLCTLVVGAIAYSRISLQLLPEGLEGTWLSISASYGALADPLEVETQLTRPIEEMLRTVPGLNEIRSRTNRNNVWISLNFSQKADMKVSYAAVRDRLERVRPQLPKTVRQIYIYRYSENDIPVIYFAYTTPPGLEDPYHLAEARIKRYLERVDGVANVDFWGPREKRIYIDLDRQRVQSLKVDLYKLTERMQRDNFALSSGYLEEGGTRHLVRSVARYGSLEEILDQPLGALGLKLRDIAAVNYRTDSELFTLRTDGQPSTQMEVVKESMANTVDVSRKVIRALTKELPAQPGLEWLDVKVFFDQGRHILEAVGNIQQTCLWGGLFAVLILLYFLRSMRMTSIITLAIPLSLLFTVIVLYFLDWSINLITMMGIMISVGMVVDNSIVVVENIFRLRQEGLTPDQAAISGASEVSLAITMSTLTTVVVFVPLILMDSDRGFTFYMIRIGVPVIVALLASLVVALYFIPLGTVKLSPKKQNPEYGFLRWLGRSYQRSLLWTLNHRLDATLILILLLASMNYPMNHMKQENWQEREREELYLSFDLPNYLSWERSQSIFNEFEDFLNKRKARYGFQNLTLRHWRTWGQIDLFMPQEKQQWYEIAYRNFRKFIGHPVDKSMTYTDIIHELADSLPKFPDVYNRVNWRSNSESDPSMDLELYGDDTPTLIELAREVKRRLQRIEGLTGVEINLDYGDDEMQVKVDRDLSRRYGLDARRVASTLAYSGSEVRLNEFRSSDKEIQMLLRFSDTDSSSLQKLRCTPIYTSSGTAVPLGTLAGFTVSKGQSQIWRENGKTKLDVRALSKNKDTKEVFAQVDKALEGFELPEGYSWDKGDRYRDQQQQDRARNFSIILGVTFVFLLMGLLFESFILPLCVIVAVPFSFLGSFWLMYLTGTPMEIMSVIGLIIMIGVVVNNAIVLIDTVKLYRERGLDRVTAILQAGAHRLRPILMTAATTIAGLLPMAVGGARMLDLSYAPMGRTMIGGLVTSTLMTLVAVPLLYTFFDDLRVFSRRVSAGFFGRAEGGNAEG